MTTLNEQRISDFLQSKLESFEETIEEYFVVCKNYIEIDPSNPTHNDEFIQRLNALYKAFTEEMDGSVPDTLKKKLISILDENTESYSNAKKRTKAINRIVKQMNTEMKEYLKSEDENRFDALEAIVELITYTEM